MPQITINNKQVEVKELAVHEVGKWLEDRKAREAADEFDPVSILLLNGGALHDLPCMTSLDADAIQDMKPSDLQKVLDKCKEVNPHFFLMRERLGLDRQ